MSVKAAVQRDHGPQWQCLIVARGDLASAKRHVQAMLTALAESGHEVQTAHVDAIENVPLRGRLT